MEVKDVIRILEDISVEKTNTDTFNNLYQAYQEADTDREVHALKLWSYMKKNRYLPEHLESNDDIAIAEMLVNIALENDDVWAYKYALVLLYHRFILSDILEKAFVSRELLSLLVALQNLAMEVEQEFISVAFDDIIYKDAFEEDDKDVWIMHFELIRAILPFIEWFHTEYQEKDEQHGYDIPGVDDATLLALIELANSMHDKKHAQQKFSAFCRYLYENIHSYSPSCILDLEE